MKKLFLVLSFFLVSSNPYAIQQVSIIPELSVPINIGGVTIFVEHKIDISDVCFNPINSGTNIGNTNSDGGLILIGNVSRKWDVGQTLDVAMNTDDLSPQDITDYCNSTSSPAALCSIDNFIADVINTARDWSQTGNIFFRYTSDWNNSDIRIRFVRGDGSHSFIGTEAEEYPTLRTMNLDPNYFLLANNFNRGSFSAVVLHEFGHAIGLEHEHRADGNLDYNQASVEKSYIKKHESEINAGTMTVDEAKEKAQYNVLDQLDTDSASYFGYSTNANGFDSASIMMYQIPKNWLNDTSFCTTPATSGTCFNYNTALSADDRDGIAQFYGTNLSDSILIIGSHDGVTGCRTVVYNDLKLKCKELANTWESSSDVHDVTDFYLRDWNILFSDYKTNAENGFQGRSCSVSASAYCDIIYVE